MELDGKTQDFAFFCATNPEVIEEGMEFAELWSGLAMELQRNRPVDQWSGDGSDLTPRIGQAFLDARELMQTTESTESAAMVILSSFWRHREYLERWRRSDSGDSMLARPIQELVELE